MMKSTLRFVLVTAGFFVSLANNSAQVCNAETISVAEIRAAIDRRASNPDPHQLSFNRKIENSENNVEYRVLWRKDAKLAFYKDCGETSVQAYNSRYGFEVVSKSSESPYLLKGFMEGFGRESFVGELWDVHRKALRYDLFIIGQFPLRTLLDDSSCKVELVANNSILVTVTPEFSSADNPKSVKCYLDRSKNYIITKAILVNHFDQEVTWEAVDVAEVSPGYYLPSSEKQTVYDRNNDTTSVTSDSKTYSMDVPPQKEFRLSAFDLPEPPGAAAWWSSPFVLMLAIGIGLIVLSGILKRFLPSKSAT